MKAKRTYAVAGALALLCLGAGTLYSNLWQPRPVATPELADTMQVAKSPLRLHLYSDGRSYSVEIMSLNFVDAHAGYLVNNDGSVVHTIFAPDGASPAKLENFFPLQKGEDFHRQKSAVTYALDGKVAREEVFRLNGTADYVLTMLPDNGQRTLTYFDDGVSIMSVIEKEKGGYWVRREEHYTKPEAGNYKDYDIVLNDNKSKTTTWYDAQSNVLKVKTSGSYDSESGTTIETFYPGTKKTRMKSETTYSDTTARFYRLDGSIESKQTLTSSQIDVEYYAVDGKTVMYKQHLKPLSGAGKTEWVIWKAEETPADGSSRELVFTPDKANALESDNRHKFSLNGKEYVQGSFSYRTTGSQTDIGTLSKSSITPADNGAQLITEEHPASDNLRADIPAYLTKLPDLSDDLPKPSGYAGFYGGYGGFGGWP
jgi:hypothetical protein